jgi:Zn-dependent protease/CBS domain-containing protein
MSVAALSLPMGSTIRILSVRGIPIYIHASWLLIYALITWSLAVGYFPRVLPDLPPAAHWANGLIAALLLFASVLLHELAHSFVARAHGLDVRGITLHVFGGVSHLADEPPSPRAEFLIAVVGPVTSFATAALAWLGARVVPDPSAGAILAYLAFVNIAVGIFNLIPGFPLDGGRVLRAILWRWKRSLARATFIASRVGVFVAFGLMALGVFQILGGNLVGGMWMILIGLFLRTAADASYAQVALREGLARIPVGQAMARNVVTVPAEATIADLAEAFWAHHFTSFPVLARDGAVLGIAALHDVHRVPRDSWSQSDVRAVMRPLTEDLTITPGESLFRAFEKASRNGLGRLAVMDGGRLVGYLSLKDITHVLALQGLAVDGLPRDEAVVSAHPLRRAA